MSPVYALFAANPEAQRSSYLYDHYKRGRAGVMKPNDDPALQAWLAGADYVREHPPVVVKKPLNGERTHPLSAHALEELRSLTRSPQPRQTINPGVVDRLSREALVEEVSLPSPYAKHKGGRIAFLRATPAGFDLVSRER